MRVVCDACTMYSTAPYLMNSLRITLHVSHFTHRTICASPGARVHSNSWGSTADYGADYGADDAWGGAVYTEVASVVDRFLYSHDDMLVVFAVGNRGGAADEGRRGGGSSGGGGEGSSGGGGEGSTIEGTIGTVESPALAKV
jgi:uncharacterized membrane protein YgcG